MRNANAKLMPIHIVAVLSLALLSFASRAVSQEDAGGIVTDPAAEFFDEADVGGVEDQLDSLDAQAEAAANNDGVVPEVSRRTSNRIEEIVVSARKREEALEDTPIAVTALSQNMLRDAGIERLDELQNLVPNLQIRDGITGYDATVIIRGVGQGDTEITFDPGVGIYVDGVYLARSQGSILSLVDTESIEVLRGPQGTLFGKNTVGGAINLTTIKPAQELGAFAYLRAGTLGTVDTRVSLDIPIDIGWLEDKLFSRFTFASQNERGYVYDAGNDVYLNNHASLGFLGSLRFLPTDDLTIDVTGSWFKDQTRARGAKCVVVQSTLLTDLFLPNGGADYFDACEGSTAYNIALNTPQLATIESYGTWATATYEAGAFGFIEDLQLKSITSWRAQESREKTDIDMTAQPVGYRGAAGGNRDFSGFGANEVGGPGAWGEPGNAWQASQEAQATVETWDGRAVGVFGAYGFWEKADTTRAEAYFPGDATRTEGGTTLKEIEVDNWSWALFAQATVDPVEWLGLTAGIRYSQDKKGYGQLLSVPPLYNRETGQETTFPPLVGSIDPVTGAEVPTSLSQTYSAWTPMASIAYRMPESYFDDTEIDSLMAYFSYSRGYKAGGFNGGARSDSESNLNAYIPETLDNFEIGSKMIAFEQRLTLNAAVFMGQYDEIQVRTIVPQPCSPAPCVPQVDLVIENAASASTRGLELEFMALPIEGLQIQGSLALLDAKYNSFPRAASDLVDPTFDPDNAFVNRSGESFPGVPQMQTHLGAQYSFPINLGSSMMNGWITPRFDWSFQTSVHYYGPELIAATQPAYHLLHLRLSYEFMNDQAQFALWGKNVTNTRYFNQATPVASTMGTVMQFYAPPATFGAEFSYRF
jgi:iron complex outermembrane receptor protein